MIDNSSLDRNNEQIFQKTILEVGQGKIQLHFSLDDINNDSEISYTSTKV